MRYYTILNLDLNRPTFNSANETIGSRKADLLLNAVSEIRHDECIKNNEAHNRYLIIQKISSTKLGNFL